MNLTQTAILTKRLILFSSIFLVVSISLFIAYRIWYAYYLASIPPVEEKADTKFGILPSPNFPKANVSSSNFSYSIDTATGSLPKLGQTKGFDKLLKVYFIPKPYLSLLSADKSKALAKKFNITQIEQPVIVSENIYKFQDQDKSLTVDLDSGNFKYINTASSSAQTVNNDDQTLIRNFNNILNALIGSKDGLDKGRNGVIYLQNIDGKLIPTNARADANLAQISIWPNSIDDKAIYTSQKDKSLINTVVFNSADNINDYFNLNFINWSIDTTTFATYPAKSPDEALQNLQSGKGILISQPQKSQASITSITLGYYLSENYTPYLQPIYIFTGPDFVAYVPAVTDQYLTTP